MAQTPPLIPVFVPPLANVLAWAENKKGSPLTQAEVEAARDGSACIMMAELDADKMSEKRGFVDVNPENCWADWHRLRPQLMGGYLPQLILCVPGDAAFRPRAEQLLSGEGVDHEFRPHDPSLEGAFRASSVSWPSFSEQDFSRIGAHAMVLYVLSPNFVAADAMPTSERFMALARRLLDAGGLAIKCESSGVAHSPARWRQLHDLTQGGGFEGCGAMFRALVAHPIGDETELYTRGMHLLGAADLIIDPAILPSSAHEPAPAAAARLFYIFAAYLLAECPVGKFCSGNTFSADADSPRYRVLWEPCSGYEQDDFFFNPFGRWRFTKP